MVRAGSELIGESEVTVGYSNVLSGVVKLSKTLPDGAPADRRAAVCVGLPLQIRKRSQRGGCH